MYQDDVIPYGAIWLVINLMKPWHMHLLATWFSGSGSTWSFSERLYTSINVSVIWIWATVLLCRGAACKNRSEG